MNDALIGLRNAIQAARLTFSAKRNRVSRGTHYRVDAVSASAVGATMTR